MRKESRFLIVICPLILLIIFGPLEKKNGYPPQFPVLSISGTTMLPTGGIIFINLYRYNQECRFWELYGQSKSAVFRPNWADLNTFLAAFEVESGEYLIEVIECGGSKFYKLVEVRFSDESVFIDTVKLSQKPYVVAF